MAARSATVIAARTARVAPSFARPCLRLQGAPNSIRHALSASPARSFAVSARTAEKKYTEDHEWIELDAAGTTGTLGVSTYAASALGDVVFVELPATDTHVNAGDPIGAVESVKSASDIMTPVSGTITQVNSLLEEKPGTINKSPEGEGWIAKVEIADKGELEGLMDATAYKAFTEEHKSDE